MERLTTREKYPHGAEGRSKDKLTGKFCRGVFEATAVIEKLAEYEDDEESGRIKRENQICKWESGMDIMSNARFRVECNGNPLKYRDVPNNFSFQDFKFCPFCGKIIEWI